MSKTKERTKYTTVSMNQADMLRVKELLKSELAIDLSYGQAGRYAVKHMIDDLEKRAARRAKRNKSANPEVEKVRKMMLETA